MGVSFLWLVVIATVLFAPKAPALDSVRVETRTDEAVEAFRVSGKGVTVVILDRGIDWEHPDFLDDAGATRIKWMLDHSGFNLCNAGNPPPVEYTEAQINSALSGGPSLAMRDAVGHGTATAGTAAGNGRGLMDRRYRGIAPEADLIVVKLTSEGAPAHDGEPAEAFFQGCIDDALDWVDEKIDLLGQPAVAIINSGTQWGPMDGTSAVSRKIDEIFGEDTPGRVMVMPSGDEGSLPNHAGADYDSMGSTVIGISRASTSFSVMSAWYTGSQPAEVTVTFDDGTTVGPVAPGTSTSASGITIINYTPGTEFYPWTSTSGDGALWIGVTGHATTGTFEIRGLNPGTGHVDLYGDVVGPNLTPITSMTDHLVPGRLNDYATTQSAVVAGNHVIRTEWVDIDGIPRSLTGEGDVGELWLKSSDGPTRDGRTHGVDLSAPGQNMFAPVGPNSYWSTFRGNLPLGSGGLYIRFGGTSGSAPLVVGATALLLEVDPTLTANDVRQILRDTAVADADTGAVPNAAWGFGKLDVYEAVRSVAEIFADGFEGGGTGSWSRVVGDVGGGGAPPS
ncbi:MAG: S8 family serine peptidase [Acidobacteriota bacterium]|nr:S8 family serine peptidase [Acidobacteriota bacterium]